MSRPPGMQRINKEDYPEDIRPSMERLAGSLNQFMEETIELFTKNIDFVNLNRQLVSIDLQIDSTGLLVNPPSIKIGVKGRVEGINCIKADNLLNPTIYPTSCPFVNYTITNGFIKIVSVTGLQNDSQYRLKLELIGS